MECSVCNKKYKLAEIYPNKISQVAMCKACHDFSYNSECTLDEDGHYAQCAWCGARNEILLCSSCKNSFCTTCIRQNFGRKVLEVIQNLKFWRCFACDGPFIKSSQENYEGICFGSNSIKESSVVKGRCCGKPSDKDLMESKLIDTASYALGSDDASDVSTNVSVGEHNLDSNVNEAVSNVNSLAVDRNQEFNRYLAEDMIAADQTYDRHSCVDFEIRLSSDDWKNALDMHRTENINTISSRRLKLGTMPTFPCFHIVAVGLEDLNIQKLKLLYPTYKITVDHDPFLLEDRTEDKSLDSDYDNPDIQSIHDSQSESQESSFLSKIERKLLGKQHPKSRKHRLKSDISDISDGKCNHSNVKRMKLESGSLNSDEDNYPSSSHDISDNESDEPISDNSSFWSSCNEFDDEHIDSECNLSDSNEASNNFSDESISDSDSTVLNMEDLISDRKARVRRSVEKDLTDADSITRISTDTESNATKAELKSALQYSPTKSESSRHKATVKDCEITHHDERQVSVSSERRRDNPSSHCSFRNADSVRDNSVSSERRRDDPSSHCSFRNADSVCDNSVKISSTLTSVNEPDNQSEHAMEIIASSKDKENTHHTNNVEDRKSPPNATHEDDSPSTVCLKKNSAGRKKIRRVLNYFELDPETRAAAKEEKKRLDRIKDQKRSKTTSSATNSQVDGFILEKHDNKKIVHVQSFISKHLKAHQMEGIKFMWTSCIESVDRIAEPGSGCIIAHSMGLGKTLQVIAFIDAVLNYGNESIQSVLVVCPKNVLLNWALEFKKWLKGENSYSVHTFSATLSSTKDRLRLLRLWHATKGLMIISYNMYTKLLSPDKSNFDRSCNDFLEQVLLEPGPDIVICDEGHLLKSQRTKISEILNRIRTKRRIILTGTPLQNNLREYYYMVNFIKPRLLGSMSEFKNRFINPIRNGLHADSTRDDVKYMKKRTYVLNLKVKAFVQRYDYDVLESELPPKHEYVIYIRMSRKQCELYKSYLEKFASDDHLHFRTYSLFGDFSNLTSIWTYPWNWKRDNNNSMTDMVSENDEVSTVSDGGCSTTWKDSSLAEDCDHLQNDTGIIDATRLDLGDTTKGNENDSANTRVNSDDGSKKAVTVDQLVLNTTINSASDKDAVDRHKKRWLEQLAKVPQEDLMTYCNKMKVVVKIIDLAYKLQEKVIIFSHSLCCLTLIEEVLRENCTPSLSYEDYCRMDGRTSAELRQRYIDKFNNSNSYRCRVFLISTRAGSLGINLTAASRVVLFDVGWNPSYDMQAIFRAYRLGQKKTVYVYRLVAKGTMEQKIYERQVTKQSLAYRVIDKRQIERHYTMSELQELYAFTPEPDNLKTPLVPQDQILAEIIQDLHPKILLSYHEHDSLLKNIESEKLTEDERKAAWEEYKADETRQLKQLQGNDNPIGLEQAQNMLSLNTNGSFGNNQEIVNSTTGELPSQLDNRSEMLPSTHAQLNFPGYRSSFGYMA